jgi:anti-sigma factor RsiW
VSKPPKAWVANLLVAYADGELDPAQMATVDDIIREDPEARAVVGIMRRSAAAVKTAFDQPLYEEVPQRLLAAVRCTGDSRLAARILPVRRPAWALYFVTAIAASIATLFVAVGTGYLQFAPDAAFRPAGTGSGNFESSLYRALERSDIGVSVRYDDVANGRSGAVTLTGNLRTSFGDGCREFRHDWVDVHGQGVEVGLACRSADSEWSVLTLPSGPVR